jgi:nicotinamidase-related amidase
MQVLVVIDAQNEFSQDGQRAVPNHASAIAQIQKRVSEARQVKWPVAWIQHFNKPHESAAFVPGTWGAELSAGFGPVDDAGPEKLFQKTVYGAFYETELEQWLKTVGATSVLLVGFYTHMCLSTTTREALVRDIEVFIDPHATGAKDLDHPELGKQNADEVRRSALLQLVHMGAKLAG